MTDPERIAQRYLAGVITADELHVRLCLVAATHAPATFADQVPTEFLDEIRTSTERIPDPKDVFLIEGGMFMRGAEAEEAIRQRREQDKVRFVEGLRAWKAYFEAVDDAGPSGAV